MIKDAEDLAPAPTAGPSPVAETFDYMSSRELGQTVLGGSKADPEEEYPKCERRNSPSMMLESAARHGSTNSRLEPTGGSLSIATTIPCSRFALAENRQNVPSAVKDADNLEWGARGIVHDDVVRKCLNRPKPKRKLG